MFTLVVILDTASKNTNLYSKQMSCKSKINFMIFFIGFIVSMTFSLTTNAQLTEKTLNKFYKNNSKAELRQVFANIHNQGIEEFSTLNNDTLKLISDLFNTVFSNSHYKSTARYFFLQATIPYVKIGKAGIPFTTKFISLTKSENAKSLQNDSLSISEILSFIGQSPYDLSNEQKGKMSKDELGEIWSNYHNRFSFLFGLIDFQWFEGHSIKSFIPYKINSLSFNDELDEVKIDYQFLDYGAIEVYRLKDKVWTEYQLIEEWYDD